MLLSTQSMEAVSMEAAIEQDPVCFLVYTLNARQMAVSHDPPPGSIGQAHVQSAVLALAFVNSSTLAIYKCRHIFLTHHFSWPTLRLGLVSDSRQKY